VGIYFFHHTPSQEYDEKQIPDAATQCCGRHRPLDRAGCAPAASRGFGAAALEPHRLDAALLVLCCLSTAPANVAD